MKYLLVTILVVFAFGVATPPLWHTHALHLVEAIVSGSALSFAAFLMDPTDFLAFSADARKTLTAWLTKKADA